jgi:hypothetical protein
MSSPRQPRTRKPNVQAPAADARNAPRSEAVVAPVHIEEDQEMSPEKTAELWQAIHVSNQEALTVFIEEADRLVEQVRQKLRLGVSATDVLRRAEDLMYNYQDFITRHKYSLGSGLSDYNQRDVKFTHLADINDLISRGIYPKGLDGRGHVLSPMQQVVLWT